MRRAHQFALTFLVVFVVRSLFGSGVAQEANKRTHDPVQDFAKLKRGMTPEQVRQLVGVPKQIARQILYHRYREQWIYDAAVPVRLTFDCPRGHPPQLLSYPEVPGKPEP
jgi:hypothetical protein